MDTIVHVRSYPLLCENSPKRDTRKLGTDSYQWVMDPDKVHSIQWKQTRYGRWGRVVEVRCEVCQPVQRPAQGRSGLAAFGKYELERRVERGVERK